RSFAAPPHSTGPHAEHAAPEARAGGMEATVYSVHPRFDSRTRGLPPLPLGLARLATLILLAATLLAWQLATAVPAHAKAGGLDPGFGSGGGGTTDSATTDDEISDKMAVQADGKPVAAGFAGEGTSRDFALARYTPSESGR